MGEAGVKAEAYAGALHTKNTTYVAQADGIVGVKLSGTAAEMRQRLTGLVVLPILFHFFAENTNQKQCFITSQAQK